MSTRYPWRFNTEVYRLPKRIFEKLKNYNSKDIPKSNPIQEAKADSDRTVANEIIEKQRIENKELRKTLLIIGIALTITIAILTVKFLFG